MATDKVEKLEQEIQALSSEELAQFRAWFLEFDWAAWDRQIERDVRAGKLDAPAEQAPRLWSARVARALNPPI